MQEKNTFFKLLKVDIASSSHTMAVLLYNLVLIFMRDNSAVELMILVPANWKIYVYLYIGILAYR